MKKLPDYLELLNNRIDNGISSLFADITRVHDTADAYTRGYRLPHKHPNVGLGLAFFDYDLSVLK